MLRRLTLLLLAAAALAGGCNPQINLGSGLGSKYSKKVDDARTKFANKLSALSTPEEILAAAEEAKDEPLLRLDVAAWLYDAGAYEQAIAQVDIALDNAGAMPAANGFRAEYMADMFNLRVAALDRLGRTDDAAKSLDECLSYPELLDCLELAPYVAVLKGDGAAFLTHAAALWKAAPGGNIDGVVLRAAARFPDQRAALRDLYRTAYQPRWDEEEQHKYRQLVLAQLELLAGDVEAAKQLYTQLGAAPILGWEVRRDRNGVLVGTAESNPVVSAVVWGGAAAAAGLRPCDQVVSLGGQPASTRFDFDVEMDRLANRLKVGDTVPVTVLRDGAEVTLTLTWGMHPGADLLRSGAPSDPAPAICPTAKVEWIPARFYN